MDNDNTKLLGILRRSKNIKVTDTNNYFTSDNVEGALSEVGLNTKTLQEFDIKSPIKTVDDIGTIIEDCTSTSGWATYSTGASISQDTTNFIIGASSLKLQTTSSGYMEYVKTGYSFNINQKNIASFRIYVGKLTNSSIRMLFRTDAGGSAYKDITGLVAGWNKVEVNMNEAIFTSGATINDTFTKILFIILTAVADDVVSISDIRILPKRKPKLCFCLDDALSSQFENGFNVFKDNGVIGTLCVLSDKVNAEGGLTTEQIKSFISIGFDTCNHSKTGDLLTSLTTKNLYNYVIECNEYLLNNADTFARTILAYPSGANNAQVIKDLQNLGFIGARATDNSTIDVPLFERQDRMKLSSKEFSSTNATNLATIDSIVSSGKTCIFYIHEITPTIAILIADAIIYAKQSGCEFIKLSDIFTKYSKK